MTVEHFLQDCEIHQNLRAETWPVNKSVREKIYGLVEILQRTAPYVDLQEFLSERTTTAKKNIDCMSMPLKTSPTQSTLVSIFRTT